MFELFKILNRLANSIRHYLVYKLSIEKEKTLQSQ